jgi:hypothetical protein
MLRRKCPAKLIKSRMKPIGGPGPLTDVVDKERRRTKPVRPLPVLAVEPKRRLMT